MHYFADVAQPVRSAILRLNLLHTLGRQGAIDCILRTCTKSLRCWYPKLNMEDVPERIAKSNMSDLPRDEAKPTKNMSLNKQMWQLEDTYPSLEHLLSPNSEPSAAAASTIVVLDTNILLLPFGIGGAKLAAIEAVYRKLIAEKRLFIPARVIREFFKNRDQKLGEILKTLNDYKSELRKPKTHVPPLLSELIETTEVEKSRRSVVEAQELYSDAVSNLVAKIRGWRGDDPITSLYRKLFTADLLIEVEQERQSLSEDWSARRENQVPPGYKDASKSDTGIGDFVIWKVMMELATKHQKDVLFVTAETKNDWFVRSEGEAIYPRPELIDEFKRETKGRHFALSSLTTLLSEMEAPGSLVEEVKAAERQANTAYNEWSEASALISRALSGIKLSTGGPEREISFDYSTNNGLLQIDNVTIRVNKAGASAVYIGKSKDTVILSRMKNVGTGQLISPSSFDATSEVYRVEVGDVFLAQNSWGDTLLARLISVMDDTRGAPYDDITLRYLVYPPGSTLIAP